MLQRQGLPKINPDLLDVPGADDSITLTTAFLPPAELGGCITLSEVFTGNDTFGYLDTSYSVPSTSSNSSTGYERLQIPYEVSYLENYDPQANYSSVSYTQLYPYDDEPEDDNDYFASRDVQFYAGDDCMDEAVPWFRSNCRANADCETFPFSVRSVFIRVPEEDDKHPNARERKNKCVLGAEYGAGSMVRPALGMVVIGLVGSVLLSAM